MNRKITFSKGEYYHIYNRGVDKRTIFERELDYNRFMILLYLCNGTQPVNLWLIKSLKGGTLQSRLNEIDRGSPLVALGTYALMPNHFHILAREIRHNGITSFMRKLTTAYTMYFNVSRERDGALFQGTFKARHASSDQYLKHLFAYIHLNPSALTKENKYRFLKTYEYSSYPDYLNTTRAWNSILTTSEFPDYFPKPEDMERMIKEWISIESGLEGPTF